MCQALNKGFMAIWRAIISARWAGLSASIWRRCQPRVEPVSASPFGIGEGAVLKCAPMANEDADLKYWVAFGLVPRIGRARFLLLEKHFGRLESAWTATAAELRAAGLDQASVTSILASRPQISPEAEMDKLRRHHVQALNWNDPSYPGKLKEIYDPPPVLYVRGEITPADEWAVAVVGTRRATPYGGPGGAPVR